MANANLPAPDVTGTEAPAAPPVATPAPQGPPMPGFSPTRMARDARERNRQLLESFGIGVDKGKIVSVPEGMGVPPAVNPITGMPETGEEEEVEQANEDANEHFKPEGEEADLLEETAETEQPDLSKGGEDIHPKEMRKLLRRFEKAETRLQEREKQLDGRLDELKKREAAFSNIMHGVMAQGAPALVAQDPQVMEFNSTYPEFGAVIEKYHGAMLSAFQGLQQQVADLAKQLHETVAAEAVDRVVGKVERAFPDAKAMVESEEFASWISALPPAISQTYINIIQETGSYTPEDAIAVLQQFVDWRARQGKPPVRPGSPNTPAAPQRRVPAPPGDGLPAARRGSAPASGNAASPFSQEELANYGTLIGQAKSPGERAALRQRLELTLRG